MSGSFNRLTSMAQPLYFDPAAYDRGVNARQGEERNALANLAFQRQERDAQVVEKLRPQVAAGDQNALMSLATVAPQQAASITGLRNAQQDQQYQQGQRTTDFLARATTALRARPMGPERDAAYRALSEQARGMGLVVPDTTPDDAALDRFMASGMTVQQQQEADRNRIVPMGGATAPAPSGGGSGSFLDTLQAQESGGNPTARNPRSSATGAFQFIDSTWQSYARANPDRFAGLTPQQVLERRNDPAESRRAAEWYAAQNGQALTSAGLPAGPGELALAHFAGGAGARALLTADPGAPVGQVLGDAVMRANPQLRGQTAGQVVESYRRRYGGTQVAGPGAPTQGMPAQPQGNLPAGATPLMRGGLPIIQGDRQAVQMPDGSRAWVPLERQPASPATYDTVTTADGVFRVNNRDPNDRVRIGDRPAPANRSADGRMPAALVRLDNTDIEEIQTASTIQADLAAFRQQIEGGQLPLSGAGNLMRRSMNYVGASSEESRNLASFEAGLEKLRNDSLRLNKGVQTEGDSQRAWNELLRNINDQEVVRQRLAEIEQINQRAVTLRFAAMNRRRQENGAEPITPEQIGVAGLAPAVGQGGAAPAGQGGQAPVMVTTPEEAAALAPGTEYTTPDGQRFRR